MEPCRPGFLRGYTLHSAPGGQGPTIPVGRKEKAKGTPSRVNNKGSKNLKRAELESDDVDFEAPARKTPKSDKKVWCEQNQWFANRVAPKSKKSGKKSQKVWCDQENHWAEVFLEVEGR